MAEFSSEEKTILVQYGIKKYENEEELNEEIDEMYDDTELMDIDMVFS